MAKYSKSGDRKKRSISSFTILLIMLLALAGVTWLVALSGGDGVTGASLSNIATSPVKGFTDALPVCLFVLILGGFLGIMTETGALDAGIATLVRKLKGNELVLIPILMLLFSIGGTTYGMCEETVPFYLLLAATMVAAGFDSIVGVSVVLLGAGVGVLGSTVNPFAVGAAVDALSGTGIELNQGIIIGLGVLLWLSSLLIAIAFVMRYAKKVKADKGSTILSLQEQEIMKREFGEGDEESKKLASKVLSARQDLTNAAIDSTHKGIKEHEAVKEHVSESMSQSEELASKVLNGRQKASLIIFAFAFVIMIIGFIPWGDFGVESFNAGSVTEDIIAPIDGPGIEEAWNDNSSMGSELALTTKSVEGVTLSQEQVKPAWSAFLTGLPLGQWYFDEASTWFLLLAILIGFVGGLSEERMVKSFIRGAGDMMSVVLIIALARSITVLMGETGLDQWILINSANFLAGVSAFVFAPLSYLLYVLLSFLIPSSSGMATVTMPIMGPLADQLGFSVETMIMIYSAGNGLVNLITPTSGAIMGGLAIAHIEYTTWLKFAAKVIGVIAVVNIIILTAAMIIF